MKNTRDLLETTVLSHPDSITIRVVSQEVVSEVASEEATVMVETSEEATATAVSSEETTTATAEETSAVHPEVASEVETHLEALAVSADRAVETTVLAELALTNNE